MKVVFTGLPYFTSRLVNELSEFDRANKYIFCNTYSSKIDQVKFLFHALNADLIVSFNGVTSKSRSLDYAIKLNKKILMQWQGSDVLSIIKNKEKGIYTEKYIKQSVSYTDAAWLKDELSGFGIACDILHFKHLLVPEINKPFKKLEVLTYIGQGKEKFYGLDSVIKLALANSDLVFNVLGTKGIDKKSPDNVNFLGWVNSDQVQEHLNSCPIYIRLTMHDGYSLSVMEAIANGNYVLWNNPHSQCVVTNEDVDLIEKFEELKQKVVANRLQRSVINMEWAKQNLNKSLILSKFVNTLTEIAR
jgi:glycosyltransferase involved in cell wall biosynthesis